MTFKPERLTDGITLYLGDCLSVLKTLPSGFVQCCVTSPPYYGLRDYGTAEWQGGDPKCDHRSPTMREGRNEDRRKLAGSAATNGAQLLLSAKCGKCGKCGASRVDHQIGLEETPELFVAKIVEVFCEVRRVLRDDGTLWLNIGDSYASSGGHTKQGENSERKGRANVVEQNKVKGYSGGGSVKTKDLIGIPWMLAFALRADGWYLRQDIIWHKPSPMPESVEDRCTKAHEYIFLLAKSERYFFDAEAIREEAAQPVGKARLTAQRKASAEGFHRNGTGNSTLGTNQGEEFRNKRSVWTVASQPLEEAHFATFPPKLIEPMILAGTSAKGCCPACGAPWVRRTETTKLKRSRPNDLTKRTREKGTGNACGNTVAGLAVKTVGWEPSCKCPAHEPVPCKILDPFNGAGTTGLVAIRNKQHYIGIELNPDYLAISRKRLLKADGTAPGTLFAEYAFENSREKYHDTVESDRAKA